MRSACMCVSSHVSHASPCACSHRYPRSGLASTRGSSCTFPSIYPWRSASPCSRWGHSCQGYCGRRALCCAPGRSSSPLRSARQHRPSPCVSPETEMCANPADAWAFSGRQRTPGSVLSRQRDDVGHEFPSHGHAPFPLAGNCHPGGLSRLRMPGPGRILNKQCINSV
jgi:hypothetical protein